MSNVHTLKILDQYYSKVDQGDKKFELRYNDRNFQVGDFIVLTEIIKNENGEIKYTGNCLMRKIIYILSDFPGLDYNYVVLGIDYPYT